MLHLIVFFPINCFLLALNFVLAIVPTPWSLYVLSGWLTGLLLHVTVFMIYVRGVIGEHKKALLLHVAASLNAMLLLVAVNWLSGMDVPWYQWPVGAMIASIIVHLIVYAMLSRKNRDGSPRKSWIERKVDEELERVQKHVSNPGGS